MKSYCVSVPLKNAEEIRRALLEKGLLRKNLAIVRSDHCIYIPITPIEEEEVLGYEVFEADFDELKERHFSYKDLVDLPEKLKVFLPTSFDVIGKIAIIKLPNELLDYKNRIGEAVLRANKGIETVAVDTGVEGKERIRQLEVVAGEKNPVTIHREYGIELEIDLSKIYFSPRLATEHWRIAQKVGEGEVIIDMFCGAGPFSIMIAKHAKPKKVYAIDINKEAIEYLNRNKRRNKVPNVIALHGDSKMVVPNLESADRIIMNLPFSSFEFFNVALSNAKDNGVIHYYEILDHERKDDRLGDMFNIAKEKGMTLKKLGERAVHTYSPDSSLYCFDLRVVRGKGNVRSDKEN